MLDKVKEFTATNTDESYTHTPQITKIFAKAIYDNIADSYDELNFKKGDVLLVIEQDTNGYEGWWLCKLHGKQGLCPGNRLRLITSYDSGCFSSSPTSSPSLSLAASSATLNSSIFSENYENKSYVDDISSLSGNEDQNKLFQCSHNQRTQTNTYWQHYLRYQPQGRSISWHSPFKEIKPQRYGVCCSSSKNIFSTPFHKSQQEYHMQQDLKGDQRIYQNTCIMSTTNDDCKTYDIPKPVTAVNYDCPKKLYPSSMSFTNTPCIDKTPTTANNCSSPLLEESYDIPRPLNSILNQQKLITPSTSNSSLPTFDCSFSSSSNRSSMANISDYDIPRRNPLPVPTLQQPSTTHGIITHLSENEKSLINHTVLSDGSIPLNTTNQRIIETTPEPIKELPLELSSALDTLAKLHAESTLAITRFLSFVMPNWRTHEKLEAVLIEVKLAAVRLRTALHDLTEFSEGALGNAMRSDDRSLGQKLKILVKALKEADKLIQESSESIEAQGGWTLENLARSGDNASSKPPDSLEQLIACAQTLIEDVRQTTSFIQGNALLLFKRNLPVTVKLSSIDDNNADTVDNYDYVSFESKEASAKKNSELREAIQLNLQNKFESVIKTAEHAALASSNEEIVSKSNELTDRDKLLVKYYAVQISTHMGNLRQAIDSFLETVEKNQPPKFFIAYGKFVVVSAHNLVTIGDIVHRNVSKSDLKHEILQCTDALSEALKSCVAKSKKAAVQFPSVTAVQEMVDSVVNISHLSFDLKTAMLQAVQLAF